MLRTPLFRSLGLAAALGLYSTAAAVAGPLPSYATGEESIKGTISSVPSKYKILVRDDRGFIDDVTLHDGTIINPTGLTLAAGQSVTILGRNSGSTFSANQIDTPYSEKSGITYAYPYITDYAYAPPYAYGYPSGYGYGFPYRYYGAPPVGFYFGRGYYGHGYYGHGYYGHGGYEGHGYYGHGGYEGRGGDFGHGGDYGHAYTGHGYAGGNAGHSFGGGSMRAGGGRSHR